QTGSTNTDLMQADTVHDRQVLLADDLCLKLVHQQAAPAGHGPYPLASNLYWWSQFEPRGQQKNTIRCQRALHEYVVDLRCCCFYYSCVNHTCTKQAHRI